MTILFEIKGQQYLALIGGLRFAFPCDLASRRLRRPGPGRSLVGAARRGGQRGWLTDIVPRIIPGIMQSGDTAGIERVMRAIMPMKKLDVPKIQQAFGPN